jgi:hypothetical protein
MKNETANEALRNVDNGDDYETLIVARRQRFDRHWRAAALAMGIPAVPFLVAAVVSGWWLAALPTMYPTLPCALVALVTTWAVRRALPRSPR